MESKTALAIGIIVVIVIIAGIAAYYSTHKGKGAKEYLVVGTSPDFPPFEYVDENGNIVGFDIDLIRLVAQKAGFKDIEIVSMDFDALIPALQQGKIDVIAAGMTITPEREKVVDFTIPYWEVDQAVIVSKTSSFKPTKLEDLAGKTVGVETGTTAASYLKDYVKKHNVDIKIKEYSSYVLAVQDLINGRIDAVMLDVPVAKMFAKKYPVEIAFVVKTGEKYGFAVKKGNKELLDKLNKALQEVMNSPEWEKLVEKYFGS
jgi:polar amino acid transport system substrate-binding protein